MVTMAPHEGGAIAAAEGAITPTVRRRRWPWVLATIAVLLVVLLVVLDRVAVSIAEGKVTPLVSQAAEDHGFTPRNTSVDINGFPFLTQVIGGDLDSVHVHMSDVQTDQLRIRELDATLTHVNVPSKALTSGDASGVKAQKIKGYVAIDPAEIQRALSTEDIKIEPRGNTLDAEVPVKWGRISTSIVGEVGAKTRGDRLVLSLQHAHVSNAPIPIPDNLVSTAVDSFASSFAIPELPFGLSIDRVGASDGKALLYASGRNVPLA